MTNEDERRVVVTWEEIAKVVFPEMQEQYPELQGKTLDEFIREWPGVELVC